jgi:hypothetical protein
VVDRLRALLEDPHDPAVARVVVFLACTVTLGLTIVVGLGGVGRSDQVPRPLVRQTSVAASSSRPTPAPAERSAVAHRTEPRQDPQDRPGSAAQRRAERELASHRALQHVPWHGDGVSIRLVGARGDRAVLVVRGASLAADRRGWRVFLDRWKDDGHSYLPRLAVGAEGGGTSGPRRGDR